MRKAKWTTGTCHCCGNPADVLEAKHPMGFTLSHARCRDCRRWCPRNGPCHRTSQPEHASTVEEMPEPLSYPTALTFTEVSEIPPPRRKRKSPRLDEGSLSTKNLLGGPT